MRHVSSFRGVSACMHAPTTYVYFHFIKQSDSLLWKILTLRSTEHFANLERQKKLVETPSDIFLSTQMLKVSGQGRKQRQARQLCCLLSLDLGNKRSVALYDPGPPPEFQGLIPSRAERALWFAAAAAAAMCACAGGPPGWWRWCGRERWEEGGDEWCIPESYQKNKQMKPQVTNTNLPAERPFYFRRVFKNAAFPQCGANVKFFLSSFQY